MIWLTWRPFRAQAVRADSHPGSLLAGGERPDWGCVPSKIMIRAATLLAAARPIPGMAGASTVHPDWAPVGARNHEAAQWPGRAALSVPHPLK